MSLNVTLIQVIFGLGGKAAAVVLDDDADLDVAANKICFQD